MHDKLRALIEHLRLHGMADALDAELARAEREAIAAPELLYRLLSQKPRRAASAAWLIASLRRACRGGGRSTASPSTGSQGSVRHRSKPWPGWTSCAGPTMSC
jgi:hypothetical protein